MPSKARQNDRPEDAEEVGELLVRVSCRANCFDVDFIGGKEAT